MADIRDVYYHGVRHQIRRVLTALGPERIEKGLTAFEDGRSSWSECFFARAFKGEADLVGCAQHPEKKLMELLHLPSHVPIRIVWNLFDQMDTWRYSNKMILSREQFRQFIESVLDESRPQEVMALLRQVSQQDLEREVKCD